MADFIKNFFFIFLDQFIDFAVFLTLIGILFLLLVAGFKIKSIFAK